MGIKQRDAQRTKSLNQDKIDLLIKYCESYKEHLQDAVHPGDPELLDNARIMEKDGANSELKKIYKKYKEVNALIDILYKEPQSHESTSDVLLQFKQRFQNTSQDIFNESRTPSGIKFIKVILTILSLGLASKLGIWHVTGNEFNTKTQKVLDVNGKDELENRLGINNRWD